MIAQPRSIVILWYFACTLSFVEYVSCIVSCGPDAPQRWSISNSVVTIGAGLRVAGAIDSVVLRGKEYVNACDHGREIQLAVTNGHGECYNPTEAGSVEDSGGSESSSVLAGINTNGDVLRTTIVPAFWMAPGTCESGCGCAVNKVKVSSYNMSKAVSFAPFGSAQSFRFLANVLIPEDNANLQIESPTGYMNGEFNRFWSIDPATGVTTEIPSPGEGHGYASSLPLCLGTQDELHVMCAISRFPVIGYVLYDFSQLTPYAESCTKWSIVRKWSNVKASTRLDIDAVICIGTLPEIRTCMMKVPANTEHWN